MPAVRFMRKSRTIESQHGADLSRVGRNDNARERETGVGRQGARDYWNVSKRKERITMHLSIDSMQSHVEFVGSEKRFM